MEDLSTRAMESIVNLLEQGAENIPPYVLDLVARYGAYISTYHFILTGVFLIATIIGTYYTIKWIRKLEKDGDYIFGVFTLIFLFIIIPLVGVIYNVQSAIEGYLIPEVKLVKEFTPSR